MLGYCLCVDRFGENQRRARSYFICFMWKLGCAALVRLCCCVCQKSYREGNQIIIFNPVLPFSNKYVLNIYYIIFSYDYEWVCWFSGISYLLFILVLFLPYRLYRTSANILVLRQQFVPIKAKYSPHQVVFWFYNSVLELIYLASWRHISSEGSWMIAELLCFVELIIIIISLRLIILY